jgi:hypothetical protein
VAAGNPFDSCVRCEYCLEGLGDEARCPECGFPVAQSRERTGLLRSADPQWVERLWRGMQDLCWAIWGLAAGVVGMLVLALVTESLGLRLGLMSRRGPGDFLLYAIGLAALALHIRGCARVAAAGHREYAAPPRVRWTVLACGAAMPVMVGLSFVLLDWLLAAGRPMQLLFTLLAQVVIMAWFFALAAALQHYEQRTATWSQNLAARHRNLRRNLYGVVFLLILFVWNVGMGRRVGDPGIGLFGLTYLLLTMAIARAGSAVRHEHLMGSTRELAREEAEKLAADSRS